MLIYSVLLISSVQQSGSVIHIFIFFIFFSTMVYYSVLNIGRPGVLQSVGLRRVRYHLVTEQQQQLNIIPCTIQ